jgi:hypothetical protein
MLTEYLVDKREFCKRALDSTVDRPHNYEAFHNMIRYLSSRLSDNGKATGDTYIVEAEDAADAVLTAYSAEVSAMSIHVKSNYVEMLKKEARRQAKHSEYSIAPLQPAYGGGA